LIFSPTISNILFGQKINHLIYLFCCSSFPHTFFDDILISDFQMLANSLIKLAEVKGVSKESLQKILQKKIKTVNPITGQQLRCDYLLKTRVDVDVVLRLERKNDSHTISNKIFDFSKTTIRQLLYDGYEETKPQLKGILGSSGTKQNK
jgi:NTE family protein